MDAGEVQEAAEIIKQSNPLLSESSSYSTDQEINAAIKMQERAQRKHNQENNTYQEDGAPTYTPQ